MGCSVSNHELLDEIERLESKLDAQRVLASAREAELLKRLAESQQETKRMRQLFYPD